ncbi:MAG: hypothetical protein JSS87_02000 [Acidobacteria bacterium]|nr:hypothetical protein [Acidobacteriota bacterium]
MISWRYPLAVLFSCRHLASLCLLWVVVVPTEDMLTNSSLHTPHRRATPLLWIAVSIVLVAALAYGFSLGHYPTFYIDDAFFAYPAIKASLGGSLTYQVSSSAPYAQELWAYHGPLFPHILTVLFRIFGFSATASRLPNFVGGWLAALVMVVFLWRRGYTFACLVLAVLWCGDRAPQEIMYGRMDGLALLLLVLNFGLLTKCLERGSTVFACAAGLLYGLTSLLNPLCAVFGLTSMLLLILMRRIRETIGCAIGLLLNIPILFGLWEFHVHDGIAQFLWHAHRLQNETALHSFIHMVVVLRWSRYWFLLMVICAVWLIAATGRRFVRDGIQSQESRPEFVLAAAFTLSALPIIFRASTHPYYIVYFSMWPMIALALLFQTAWRKYRVIAITIILVWCSSAAWNGLRLREAVKYYRGLNNDALVSIINTRIPADQEIVATPELYAIPLEANHSNFDLTAWFPERQDICHVCYLLMTEQEYKDASYVARPNMAKRSLLYSGPAFPGTGPLQYPIVVLSPESP